ncbi:exodeoxyribonuclease VII large subunit [Bacilli bacterium PM5-3]|nr:exodeoxyribonuclease VII large subunit [Bacilli bacterium PM5-3]MDH6603067.1 exodeoxyribonuclease VII large subunit [Bacilli bacterium PM5-9]
MKKVSVSDLVKYLKHINEKDSNLFNLSISGELSNVKVYPSKHMYFDLKDDNSKISGIMFAQNTKSLMFKPQDGDKVKVIGSVKVYQNNATFQVIANKIEKDGFGELYVQFEKNKAELKKAGYFLEEHKKAIPIFPNKIAIIAGHNSAALKDVLTTLNSRYKLSQLVVFESAVQGKDAPKKLINTIETINKYQFDVIILARGGGSFEDLNAFNDVSLAMCIFNSKIPIVTGIGHETDYTIADFVSDYRALTPTAAAIKVSPNTSDLNNQLIRYQNNLKTSFENIININYQRLDNDYVLLKSTFNNKIINLKNYLSDKKLKLEKNNIKYKLQRYKQKIYEYQLILSNSLKFELSTKNQILSNNYDKLNKSFENKLKTTKQQLNENIIRLNLLDPNLVISKGYAIVYQDNKLVKDYSLLNKGDDINIIGNKAKINAKVEEVTINENK